MDAILLHLQNKKTQLSSSNKKLSSETAKSREIKKTEKEIEKLKKTILKNEYVGDGDFSVNILLIGVTIIAVIWIYILLSPEVIDLGNWVLASPGFLVIVFCVTMLRFGSASIKRNDDKKILRNLEDWKEKLPKPKENQKNHLKIKKEISLLKKKYYKKLKTHFIQFYDKNNNGELDILEDSDDYMNLLQENQDKIIEISEKMGMEYIDPLIKIDEKLRTKRESLNLTLNKILKPDNNYDDKLNIETLEKFLKEEVHTYNLLLTNSLFMVSSLIANDRITFRRIYEKFDKLNMFNSHYENQTIQLLNDVNENLVRLLTKIDNLNNSISASIANMNYITEKNSKELSGQLEKVNSSIKLNTFIAGVNAYQNYKTNKNTKSLR